MAKNKAFSPMLATLGSVADVTTDDADETVSDEWAFEMKWDGIRAIATIRDGAVTFETRNGIDVTSTYPDLGELVQRVDGDAILDGEIVALSKAGRPDFGRLQKRMKLTRRSDVDPAAKATPVHYMVFDIVEKDGTVLTARGYDERRDILAMTVKSAGRIQVPPAFDGDLDSAIRSSLELGLEGVMAKKRDATYAVGRRSRAWIKIKHHLTQEVVIGGWRPGKGRRSSTVGSLLMGIPSEGGLRYVGRVGTGFAERDLVELTARFAKLERKTSPFDDVPRADASDARWITPSLVGEVEFAEWTPTGKLRQPSWRGWRTDKSFTDVVREG
jgi:bifunctional non-homologous end joining protein LigD